MTSVTNQIWKYTKNKLLLKHFFPCILLHQCSRLSLNMRLHKNIHTFTLSMFSRIFLFACFSKISCKQCNQTAAAAATLFHIYMYLQFLQYFSLYFYHDSQGIENDQVYISRTCFYIQDHRSKLLNFIYFILLASTLDRNLS